MVSRFRSRKIWKRKRYGEEKGMVKFLSVILLSLVLLTSLPLESLAPRSLTQNLVSVPDDSVLDTTPSVLPEEVLPPPVYNPFYSSSDSDMVPSAPPQDLTRDSIVDMTQNQREEEGVVSERAPPQNYKNRLERYLSRNSMSFVTILLFIFGSVFILTHCATLGLHIYHVLQTLAVDVTNLEHFIVQTGGESYLVITKEGVEPLTLEGTENSSDIFKLDDDVLAVKAQDLNGEYSIDVSFDVYEDLRFSAHALHDTEEAFSVLSGRYQEITLTGSGFEGALDNGRYYIVTFTGEADKVSLNPNEGLVFIQDFDSGEKLYLTLSPNEEGNFGVDIYNEDGDVLLHIGELSHDSQNIRLEWERKMDIEVFQGDYSEVINKGNEDKVFYTALDKTTVTEEFARNQNIKLGLTGLMIVILVESFALLGVSLLPFKHYKQLSSKLKKKLFASAFLHVIVTVLTLVALLIHEYVPYGGLAIGLTYLFSIPSFIVFIVFLKQFKKSRKGISRAEEIPLDIIEGTAEGERKEKRGIVREKTGASSFERRYDRDGGEFLEERQDVEIRLSQGEDENEGESLLKLSGENRRDEKRLWKKK